MLRIFLQRPLTQEEAIKKLSQTEKIKCYTSQILALNESEKQMPGKTFDIMA